MADLSKLSLGGVTKSFQDSYVQTQLDVLNGIVSGGISIVIVDTLPTPPTAADMGNNWYSYTAFLITYVKDGNYEAMRETNTQIETDLYLKTEYYHVPNFLNGVYARSRLYRPSGNAISSDYNIKYKYNDTTTESWEEQDESFLFMNGQGYAVFANCYSDTNHSRRAYETLEPIISID